MPFVERLAPRALCGQYVHPFAGLYLAQCAGGRGVFRLQFDVLRRVHFLCAPGTDVFSGQIAHFPLIEHFGPRAVGGAQNQHLSLFQRRHALGRSVGLRVQPCFLDHDRRRVRAGRPRKLRRPRQDRKDHRRQRNPCGAHYLFHFFQGTSSGEYRRGHYITKVFQNQDKNSALRFSRRFHRRAARRMRICPAAGIGIGRPPQMPKKRQYGADYA